PPTTAKWSPTISRTAHTSTDTLYSTSSVCIPPGAPPPPRLEKKYRRPSSPSRPRPSASNPFPNHDASPRPCSSGGHGGDPGTLARHLTVPPRARTRRLALRPPSALNQF